MKNLFYILIVTVLTGIVSCTELPLGQTPIDNMPPSSVTNVDIEPTPGGAIITYDLPNEKDISYVKGEYVYKGETHVVRSSIYKNYLVIEGIGDTEPLEIIIYVVDHSENLSVGEKLIFTPLTPPWVAILETLEIFPIFGGVGVKWTNETATEVGVTVFTEDSLGIMRENRTQYSKDVEGELSFRPYDTIPYRFAVRITDKWGNVSTFKEATVTPLFEKLFDKLKFDEVGLPGDNTSVNNNRPLKNTWDGNDGTIWHAVEGQFMPFPMYITIDLGLEVKFSRMRLMTRNGYWYDNHNFRTFEVWGAKNYKHDKLVEYWTSRDNADWRNAEWRTDGDWELLGDFEIKRPSGDPTPIRNPTGEDLAAAQAGFNFNVPFEKEKLQYLRFVIKTTWATGALHMAEFYFYGDDK